MNEQNGDPDFRSFNSRGDEMMRTPGETAPARGYVKLRKSNPASCILNPMENDN